VIYPMKQNEHRFFDIPDETWTIFIIRTVNSTGFSATIPFLAVYLNEVRSVPLSEIGIVYLVSGILGLGSQVMGGRLTDSVGPKKVMLASYATSICFSAVLGYMVLISANVVVFFVIYPAFSLVRGVSQPASSSIIAGQKTSEVRTGFSLLNIGGNLGFAIGPAVGGLVSTIYDYASVFTISASASFAVFLIALALIKGGRRSPENVPLKKKIRIRFDYRGNRSMILFLGLTSCLFLAVGYEIIPLSLYASNFLHLSNDLIGYLFATNGLVIVVLQLPLTKLIERARRILIPMIISCLLAASAFVIAANSTNFAGLETMMFVVTLAEILLTVPSQTIIALFSNSSNRGAYQGYYSAGSNAGRSVASFIGPLSFSLLVFDPSLSWYLISAFSILIGLGFLLLSPSLQRDYEKIYPWKKHGG
jgi:MFS family permease